MISPNCPKTEGPRTDVFDTLRAEYEPWLEQCLVRPLDFGQLTSDRSLVIFGETGSGKSALYKALAFSCLDESGEPRRLIVDWRVTETSDEHSSEIMGVQAQVKQIYDMCAHELGRFVLSYPHRYENAPEWARDRISWFIHYFMLGPREERFAPYMDSSPGGSVLHGLLQESPPEILWQDAATELVMNEVNLGLSQMGLESIWIVSDEIERLVQIDQDTVLRKLTALLATLPLFERSRLGFKFLIPRRLESTVSSASGPFRRRIDAYRIRWHPDELQEIVNGRLMLATGDDQFKLQNLVSAPIFAQWLDTVGANSPRAWLEQVGHIFDYWAMQGSDTPIDEKTWRELNRQHPPRLILDSGTRQVTVGGREIAPQSLSTNDYDILQYLYENSNRPVSKSELYYRVYRSLDYVPKSRDEKNYSDPAVMDNMMTSCIWRIRQAIEPEPNHPILLIATRGYGYTLSVRW